MPRRRLQSQRSSVRDNTERKLIKPMETINRPTLERYLASSDLTPEQKAQLLQELADSKGDRAVLTKAMQLNGRKSMTKVPHIAHK